MFIIHPPEMDQLAQPFANRAGAMFAVEREKPWIKFSRADSTGGATLFEGKDLLLSMIIHEDKRAITLLKGLAYEEVKIRARDCANYHLDGMLLISAQGHTFLELCHPAIDSGLSVTLANGVVDYILMKTLPCSYNWS